MEPRFQIFVSSTFTDLAGERKHVIDELIKVGFIAIGMEQFPAADEEQMAFIEPLIDESDYYMIIMKGRYGSLNPRTKKSYTHMEYEYAVSRGKPVIAFIYKDIKNIALNDTDQDPSRMRKLQKFKEELESKKIVNYWEDERQLSSAVKDALYYLIRTKPGVGWVRGDKAISSDVLANMAELRAENDQMKEKFKSLEYLKEYSLADLEQGDDPLNLQYFLEQIVKTDDGLVKERTGPFDWESTWDRTFLNLVELIYTEASEDRMNYFLKNRIKTNLGSKEKRQIVFDDSPIKKLRYQYQALMLIEVITKRIEDSDNPGETYDVICWRLTETGRRHISVARAKKRPR